MLHNNSRSQASVEYLIVIGVGLAILTGFLIYAFAYTSGYNTSKIGHELDVALGSLSNTVGYLSSQQTGSVLGFSFNSPGLSIGSSYFCQNSIVLSSSGLEAAKGTGVQVVGELPVGAGKFSGEGEAVVINGRQSVAIKFDLPIAYISSSYNLVGNVLSYNLSFESLSGNLVAGVNFTLAVYSLSGSLLSSANYTTATGVYNGEVSASSAYSGFRIVIYPYSYGVMSSSCFTSSESIPITITNTQLSATSAPFQQTVTVNSSSYYKYEANNLQNVQFSYSNGTVIPSWLESGNLATFSGEVGQYIYNPSDTPLSSINPVTVTAWIRYNGVNTGNWEGIFGFSSSGVCPFEHIALNNGLLTLDNCGNDGGNFATSFTPKTNVWTFVAYVIDGESVTIYMDNRSQSFTATGVYNPAVNSFDIGTEGYAYGRPSFEGEIANIQVYGSALSSSNIQNIYGNGLGGQPIQNLGLAGWWTLAGNANDSSGNGNNGINNNVKFLGSGSESTATTYWLKINSGIPAASQLLVDMYFYPKNYNLFNTVNTGEAPQLSTTYGEYDDGANVFLNYYSGASDSGWTLAGTSGQTSSAPSGSPFGTNALYALDSGESYMYTTAAGQSTNMIIEYYTYINRLNDVFFLENSNGAGQLARQGDGSGWYGIASTSSWTSWNAPPDTGSWSGEWVLSGVVVADGTATQYLSTTLGNYRSEIGQNPSNTYTVSNNGNYLGLVGDGGGSADEYWNGLIIRAYPPNGVMPSVSFGSIE